MQDPWKTSYDIAMFHLNTYLLCRFCCTSTDQVKLKAPQLGRIQLLSRMPFLPRILAAVQLKPKTSVTQKQMKGWFVVVFGMFLVGMPNFLEDCRIALAFFFLRACEKKQRMKIQPHQEALHLGIKTNDHHQNHHDSDKTNPEIVLMEKILHQLVDSWSHYLYTYEFYTSQAVQDFFHQQYVCTFLPPWKKKHLPIDHFAIIPDMWQPHLPWLCWYSSLRMPDSKKQRYEHHQQFTGKWNPRCVLLACNKSISGVCDNSKSTEPITSWVKPTKADPT